jgi:MFS family permease
LAPKLSLAPALSARSPFYYGWVVAGVMGVVSFSSVAFTPVLIGSFFREMASEFGWSLTLLSGAQLAGSVIALFLSPVAGWFQDRYGARAVLSASMGIIVLCLFLMGLITSPLMYYVVLGLGVGIVVGPIRIAPAAAIAQWFVRKRGAATSILGIGISLGFATLPVLGALVSAHFGWRVGWWAIATAVAVVTLPPCFLLLLRHPTDIGQQVDGDTLGRIGQPTSPRGWSASTEVQWTTKEAMRTPALWLLVLSTSCIVMTFMGLSTHLVPFLLSRGISTGYAALAVNIGGISAIPASIVWGWLMDRTPVRRLVAATGAWTIILILAMAHTGSTWMILPVGLAWGIGAASTGTVIRAVFAYYFGRTSAGTILGVVTPFRVISQGVGILLAGVIYDATGSYLAAFYLFVALSIVAMAAAEFAPAPRKEESASSQQV